MKSILRRIFLPLLLLCAMTASAVEVQRYYLMEFFGPFMCHFLRFSYCQPYGTHLYLFVVQQDEAKVGKTTYTLSTVSEDGQQAVFTGPLNGLGTAETFTLRSPIVIKESHLELN